MFSCGDGIFVSNEFEAYSTPKVHSNPQRPLFTPPTAGQGAGHGVMRVWRNECLVDMQMITSIIVGLAE